MLKLAPWVDPQGGFHLTNCPTFPGALGWSTGRVPSPYLPHITRRLGLIHMADPISLPAPHYPTPWADPQDGSHLSTCPTFPGALGWSTGRVPSRYLPHITRRLGLIHRTGPISLPAPHSPAPWVDPQGGSHLATCPTFPSALAMDLLLNTLKRLSATIVVLIIFFLRLQSTVIGNEIFAQTSRFVNVWVSNIYIWGSFTHFNSLI